MLLVSLLALPKVGFYLERLQEIAVVYIPKVLAAILLLIVGWWLIGWGSRLVAAATARLDVSLSSFLTSMFSIALKVLLLMSAAGMVGFETTSFVAVVGAAGLAVGLALQGTLANFAGGVLILIFKPFTIGDVIESQGRTGTVQSIQIFNTIVLTPQGDTAILPNGATSNGVIVNKAHPQRALVDIQLELDSATNFDALRQQVMPLLRHDNEVPDAPAPQVVLVGLKPGATMTVAFRAYAHPGQEEALRNHLMERLQQWFAQKPLADAAPAS